MPTCSRLPVTMLRYFTVYGPWGRPDMAIWKFTDALLRGPAARRLRRRRRCMRDFTFGEDAARGDRGPDVVVRQRGSAAATTCSARAAGSAELPRFAAGRRSTIYNVGRSDPVSVNALAVDGSKAIDRTPRAIRQRTGHAAGRRRAARSPTRASCSRRWPPAICPQVPLADGLEPLRALVSGLSPALSAPIGPGRPGR
jgi:nucleoside-diphosphate-sugar epimerase